jgi:site-specific DNA-methyltransferase (cytosine-N4-specific)
MHPAPMQLGMVRFFIKMLTDKRDLVLDPFGGSNSTGAIAEDLDRKWVAVEPNREYADGSKARFPQFAGARTSSSRPADHQSEVLFTQP